MITTEILAFVFFTMLFAYFSILIALFVIGIGCIVMALGHSEKDRLPTHLKFNPLNVLINEASLDHRGRRYRKLGIRFISWFLFLGATGVLALNIGQFLVN
jgi:hypothetical protein